MERNSETTNPIYIYIYICIYVRFYLIIHEFQNLDLQYFENNRSNYSDKQNKTCCTYPMAALADSSCY